MNTADAPDDPILATLSTLHTCDVSRSRAERLRRQCHASLQVAMTRPLDGGFTTEAPSWRRIAGPAIAGAWCAIYVFETIRRTAAFYGL